MAQAFFPGIFPVVTFAGNYIADRTIGEESSRKKDGK